MTFNISIYADNTTLYFCVFRSDLLEQLELASQPDFNM